MINENKSLKKLLFNIIVSLRPHQWIKNLILFIPSIAYGNFSLENFYTIFKVFIGFSLVVSSTYILNDLVDIKADQSHPQKKFRPIASQTLPNFIWLAISFFVFFIGTNILFIEDTYLLIWSNLYCVLTLSYTTKLKFIKYFDVLVVSSLFCIRLFVGSQPLDIIISKELLFFVLFTSLGLVSSKKFSILINNKIMHNKVKQFLVDSYSEKFLLNLSIFSFTLSTVIYFYWVFFVKFTDVNYFQILILIFSCLIIGGIKYYLVKNIYNENIEDVIKFIFQNKRMFLLSIIFFLLTAYVL